MLVVFNCKNDNLKAVSIDYLENGYYHKIYQADSLYIIGNYDASFKLLETAFAEAKPLNLSVYAEYRTYVKAMKQLNYSDKSYIGFQKLISNYGNTLETMKYDSILNAIYLDNKLKVDENYESWRQTYLASLNLDLREKIKDMMSLDQKFRRANYSDNMQEQTKIDKKNIETIIKLFDTHGYINEAKIGNYLVDKERASIDAILLHTDDSIREAYVMPKLLDYVKSGQCNPLIYARVVDQLYLYNGEPQIYGTYKDDTGGYMAISNPDKLDSLRKSIGLPKFGYEDWRFEKLY